MQITDLKIILTLAAVVLVWLTCSSILVLTTTAQTTGNIENDFLILVNAERTGQGKSPLTANSQLENAAYLHSKDMGNNNYFSHTSQDGTQFSQRITSAGYKYVAAAENIAKAYGSPDAAKVYDMWKNSPGHYANMIGNYLDAGLGVYSINGYTYYTLDLGRSQNSQPTQTINPSNSPTPSPKPSTPTTLPGPTSIPTPTVTLSSAATPTPSSLPSPLLSISPSITYPTSYTSPAPTSTTKIPELIILILLPTLVLVLSIVIVIKLKGSKKPCFYT